MLIGHSAGAHLCALTTLFLTDEREELCIEAGVQREVAESVRGVIGKDRCAVRHPSIRMCPRTSHTLYTYLFGSGSGLSGVYNVPDHYQHEQKRAVEYVSAMHKAMNGVENFPYYSPTHVLTEASQDTLSR